MWEYTYVTLTDFNHNGTLTGVHVNGEKVKAKALTLTQLLGKLGAEGWELVTHMSNAPTEFRRGRDQLMIFKRRKQ